MRRSLAAAFFCGLSGVLYAQVTFTPNTTNGEAALSLIGPGVQVQSLVLQGRPEAIARFQGNSNIGITDGVVLCTNDAVNLAGPNDISSGVTGGPFTPSLPDPDLTLLLGGGLGTPDTYGHYVLDMTFVPVYDSLLFNYVFASEEYDSWACSQYNDAFAFFLSGPGINGPFSNNAKNIALVPGSDAYVSVNSVNSGAIPVNANGPVPDPFRACFAADSGWVDNVPYYVYNGTGASYENFTLTEIPYCCNAYYLQPN
ncbi:MAG TPA: choice-of-anchor L domain-containing protein, partial [Flavobacteriales bacterium]|nr:choice-of-anchor L domain-containing protein [Flavobacteriales bacterium]